MKVQDPHDDEYDNSHLMTARTIQKLLLFIISQWSRQGTNIMEDPRPSFVEHCRLLIKWTKLVKDKGLLMNFHDFPRQN